MMAISMPLSFRSLYISTGVPSAAFPKGWGFNSGVLDSLVRREHDATAPAIVIPKVRLSIFTFTFNLLQMASVVIIQEPRRIERFERYPGCLKSGSVDL